VPVGFGWHCEQSAIRWLDRLMTRHPGGQLAESARAEKRRLIEGRDLTSTAD
jgi:hypothetical protein